MQVRLSRLLQAAPWRKRLEFIVVEVPVPVPSVEPFWVSNGAGEVSMTACKSDRRPFGPGWPEPLPRW